MNRLVLYKWILTLSITLPMISPCSYAQQENTVNGQSTPTSHWQTLFDGTSLEGWRNYGGKNTSIRKWQIEDGTLALKQNRLFPKIDMIRSALFGGPSGDLIYHQAMFDNFELSLEWKISEGGNSGVFYLVENEDQNAPWSSGLEMQILDNEGHRDGQSPTHRAGALYDLIAPSSEPLHPVGCWNHYRIVVNDDNIAHWINGHEVLSVRRHSDQWYQLKQASKFADSSHYGTATAGYIVLQDHGDAVWYRNIRIRRLRSDTPINTGR